MCATIGDDGSSRTSAKPTSRGFGTRVVEPGRLGYIAPPFRPGGHYAPFLDAHEQAVAAELSFLHRHVLAADPVRI